jgi:hypothetical protein
VSDRLTEHVRRFETALSSGDWARFVDGFAEDAVMTFSGVPAGSMAISWRDGLVARLAIGFD